MLRVEEAEKIILLHTRDFGAEPVTFETALGRVLAQDIHADRDLPPANRVTMDGIAIQYAAYEKGVREFTIKATQAAGDVPVRITAENECVEIMTGAALDESTDTIIRYEDLEIKDGIATVKDVPVRKGQNIHVKGRDRKENDVLVEKGMTVNAAVINAAASVGASEVWVKKLPGVIIVSTGDELIGVTEKPEAYQVRRSNAYAVKAALKQFGLFADLLHMKDEEEAINLHIQQALADYDVMIISGGVSMGKYDYIPKVLEQNGVKQLFHKVQQRPGKPFWFGAHDSGVKVFAFPGNTVSTFMCLHRYFIPWLMASMEAKQKPPVYAVLDENFRFEPALQYFSQVKLRTDEQGRLLATPAEGNGSGDFANLAGTDAFMELPLEKTDFSKGEVYRVWPF
jgi:molybdopterin molybdotransferase